MNIIDKIQKVTIIFIIISVYANPINANENNYPTREKNSIGIGLYLGGPEIFSSIAIDYFFSPTFNIELGLGQLEAEETTTNFISGEKKTNKWTENLAHFGFKYYFTGKSKYSGWSPYVGILPGILTASPKKSYFLFTTGETETVNYSISTFRLIIPIGMEYIGTSGFTFAAEAEYHYTKDAELKTTTSDGIEHSDTMLIGDLTFWGGIKIGWHF